MQTSVFEANKAVKNCLIQAVFTTNPKPSPSGADLPSLTDFKPHPDLLSFVGQ
jgi:hypothetical protein